ncbi:MAG: AGE family epimerase/isomerase [Verrucomicrobiia bacterium]
MKHLMNLCEWFVPRGAGMFLAVLLLAPPGALAAAQPSAPDRDQMLNQAERCRKILRTSLVDFYLPACVDERNGGYLESLRDGQFVPIGEKFLTLQARQLWFFSTLAIEGFEREKALAAAKAGYDFIQGKMLDRSNGGYFSKVADDGGPRDTRKHAYLNAFALYGLVAYHRASGDARALQAAKDLFGVLEQRAYDTQHGGYIEFFSSDWKPVTDPKESGYVGAIGHKTYNTHLHLLEAFAELCRVWPDALVGKRLQELITINTSTVRTPIVESNVDAFYRDWRVVNQPRNLRASYGHDVECAWLTLDAVRTLGTPPGLFRSWAEALCQSSIKHGFDWEHGGFFSGGPLGKPADDKEKVWWVQSEAIVSMLDMFRLTGDPMYYDLFARTLDFVEKHQVAKDGSWWASRAADGSATRNQTRTSPWQAGYHAGRSMILAAKALEKMATGAPNPLAPSAK